MLDPSSSSRPSQPARVSLFRLHNLCFKAYVSLSPHSRILLILVVSTTDHYSSNERASTNKAISGLFVSIGGSSLIRKAGRQHLQSQLPEY